MDADAARASVSSEKRARNYVSSGAMTQEVAMLHSIAKSLPVSNLCEQLQAIGAKACANINNTAHSLRTNLWQHLACSP